MREVMIGLWRHKATAVLYDVLFVGTAAWDVDQMLIAYRLHSNGERPIWIRAQSEFMDKFEAVNEISDGKKEW